MANSTNRTINIWINDKQVVNSYKGITGAMRQARNELANMTIGSKEYIAQTQKIKQLDRALHDHSVMQGKIKTGWTKIRNDVKAYAAGEILANSFQRVVMGIGDAFKFITKNTMDAEQGITNVFTNLSDADIAKYGDTLKAGSLEVMKLGFSITDTNQAMFDAVSAGISAGNAIDFMTKSAVLAKGGMADLGTAVDMNTTFVNAYKLEMSELANVQDAVFTASKFGKTSVQQLADNVGKLAPIAANAGMSYQELLSSTAELTLSGISTSESVNYLKAAMSSLIKPSKEAETEMRKFGVPFGVTAMKAEGFTKVLGKLNEVAKTSPDALAKIIPSVEGQTAVLALTNKGFEHYQEILKAVLTDIGANSSLQKAYNMQTETMAGMVAKAKGELTAMSITLGEKLAPIMKAIMPYFSGLMKHIVALVDWIQRNIKFIGMMAKVLTVATVAIISYNVALKLATLWTKTTAAAQALMRTSSLLLAFAQAKLTGNVTRANAAMKMLNLSMKSNPFGLVLVVIGAVATALMLFNERTEKTNRAQSMMAEVTKDAGNAIAQEKVKVEQLLAIAKDDTKSKEDRLEAVKRLNAISPEYLGNITLEKINTINTIKAINNYIAALERKMKAQIALKKLEQIESEILDASFEQIYATQKLNEINAKLEKEDSKPRIPGERISSGTLFSAQAALAASALDNAESDLERLNQVKKEFMTMLDSLDISLLDAINTDTGTGGTGGTETSEQELKKKTDAYKKTIEDFYAEIARIRRENGQATLTDEEKLLNNTHTHYSDMLAVVGNAISELEKKQETRHGLNAEETETLTKFYYQRVLLTQMYQEDITRITQAGEKKRLEAKQAFQNELNNILASEELQELNTVAEKYQKLIKKAEEFGIDTTELYEKMNAELAEIRTKYAEDGTVMFGMTEEEFDVWKENVLKIIGYIGKIGDAWASINTIRANQEEKEMQRYERNMEMRREKLDKQLADGLISEKNYNLRIQALDAQTEAKKRDIARRQAAREKAQKIFEAGINTASAVVEALPNLVMAGIVGGIGLLNIAAIASEPLPAYGKGGRINKPEIALVGEKGREIMLSNSIVDDPQLGPIADDLARIQEGKSPRYIKQPPAPNFKAMSEAIGAQPRAYGSVTTGTNVNNIDTKALTNVASEISDMRKGIAEMTRTVAGMKYLKAVITQRNLDDRNIEQEVLKRYSNF